MLPRRHRLTDADDFRRAVRGVRAGTSTVVVHVVGSPAAPGRVGFAVSRAVGNAVVRNRTKRRLRAIVAGTLDDVGPGIDVVVRATPRAASASTEELSRDVSGALGRAVRKLDRA